MRLSERHGLTQLHGNAYRNAAQLPAGPVLVVGDGNSGRQIAAELPVTRRVDLALSGTGLVVPQRLLGRDLVLAGEQLVHDRGVTPAPGLYVLGRLWQRNRGSALLGFVGREAAELADRIATRRNHRCDRAPAHHNLDPSVPSARSTSC